MGLLRPFFSAEAEIVESRLLGIENLLPSTQELDGVPVTKPVVKEKLPIFGARHIREADKTGTFFVYRYRRQKNKFMRIKLAIALSLLPVLLSAQSTSPSKGGSSMNKVKLSNMSSSVFPNSKSGPFLPPTVALK